MMLHAFIIEKLEKNAAVFSALLGNHRSEHVKWRPAEDKWSLLEVVNHLYDEEIFDFRQRLQFAVLKPDKPWTRVSPQEWVTSNRYYDREMGPSLNKFLQERENSVRWLNELDSPDWQAIDNYPYGKPLTAEKILVNWLAHDYLHIRQINVINWQYLSKIAAPVDLQYAGNW